MTSRKPRKRGQDVTKHAVFAALAVSFLAAGCGQNRPVSDTPPGATCTEPTSEYAPRGLGCAGERLENAWGGGSSETPSASPLDLLQPQLFFAVALLIMSIYTLRRRDDEATLCGLPPHRDPQGPAAGRMLVAAARTRVLGWIGIAAAAVLLASMWGAGTAILAGVPAGLIVWAVAARHGHLATTAAGYGIADERWQQATGEAEMAGRRPPAEPRMSRADAHALGETKGFQAPEGSAATAMLDIAGKPGPTLAAWARVAQALKLGTVDPTGETFTPWAVIEAVQLLPGGDVEVVFRLDDITKTVESFRPAIGPLLRELRVRELVGGAFTTRHSDGRIVGRFSNGGASATPQAEQPDDEWDF